MLLNLINFYLLNLIKKFLNVCNDKFEQGDWKAKGQISLRVTIEFLHLEQNGFLLVLIQSNLFISILKTLQSHHFID